MSFEAVEFESEGATLRGRFYRPSGGGEAPWATVVMAHGFSSTLGMVADRYAEVFQAAGLAALLYDHRNFGISDGEPRYQLSAFLQMRGYRDAISHALTLDEVDGERIAIWGCSLTGGVALKVASAEERVRAVVAQVPACGDDPPPSDVDESIFAGAREAYLDGRVHAPLPDASEPMPVVSSDQIGTPSAVRPLTAYRWFIEYGARPEIGWENRVTFADNPSDPEGRTGSPGVWTPHLRAAAQMVVSPQDEMEGASPEVARLVYDSIPGRKEWVEVGGGHFGLLYHPGSWFDEAAAAERDFLLRELG